MIQDFDWPYPTHDADAIGPLHGGDVCPWCGEALKQLEEGVRARDGERDEVIELCPTDVSVAVLHPDCYREVEADLKAARNHDLTDFDKVTP